MRAGERGNVGGYCTIGRRASPSSGLALTSMLRRESNPSELVVTTVPKSLRDAMAAKHGGRLVWQWMPDGTLSVALKYPSGPRPMQGGIDARKEEGQVDRGLNTRHG